MAFLVCGLFLGAAQASADVAFFEAIRDVPLAPGLVENQGETLVFDKPDGRFVESTATLSGATIPAVRSYYGQALPQFGWSQSGTDTYIRGDEILEFSFFEDDVSAAMLISIRPR